MHVQGESLKTVAIRIFQLPDHQDGERTVAITVRLLLAVVTVSTVLMMRINSSWSQNLQGGIFGVVGRALGIERDQVCVIHHRHQRVEGGTVSGLPPNIPDTMFVAPDGRPQVLSREQCEQENQRSLAAEELEYEQSIFQAQRKQSASTASAATTSTPGPLRWRDGYIDNGRFIKANWRTIEADNGAVTAIDMKSIVHDAEGRGANVVAYVVESDFFDPSNLRGFTFDCDGRFSVLSAVGLSPMVYAPPRSVAAQIGALACAGARSVCDMARQNGMTCN